VATNPLSPEAAALRAVKVAMKAIQKSDALTITTHAVTNSTDYRALLDELVGMSRPFGVWVVQAKETE
jgi:hypothetical protein